MNWGDIPPLTCQLCGEEFPPTLDEPHDCQEDD